MPDKLPGLSKSVDDYLKVIHALSASGPEVSASIIADALEIEPDAVVEMVARLIESGFVEKQPYKGLKLTPIGVVAALRILRRHRILETYLSMKLGYSSKEVRQEAEQLEQVASEELIERMSTALGDPGHDPQGAPIPSRDEESGARDSITLAELSVGMEAQVRSLNADDTIGMKACQSVGLLPGTRVVVKEKNRQGGFLRVEVGPSGGPVAEVGIGVAYRVFVVLLPDWAVEEKPE